MSTREDILDAIGKASIGVDHVRIAVDDDADPDDPDVHIAHALNLLFQDAEQRTRDLRENEALFRSYFQRALQGMVMTSPEGVLLEVNDAAARLVGRAPEEMKGRHFAEFTHPDDVDGNKALVAKLKAGGLEKLEFDKRYLHKDGREVWAHVSSTLLRDPEGRPLRFLTQMVDVTEQRRAEKAERLSRERLDLAIEAAGIGFFYCDLPTGELTLSARVHDQFGTPHDEPARAAAYLALVHPEDAPRVRDKAARSIAACGSFRDDFRIVRPDGALRWIRGVGRVQADAKGNATRFDGATLDVTDEHERESQLQAAKLELAAAERLSALGSLVSGVAHELRTPLAYLQNNVHLLQRRLEKGATEDRKAAEVLADYAPLADDISAAVDRINALIRDLKRFTKLEPGTRLEQSLDHQVGEAANLFLATHRSAIRFDLSLDPTPAVPVDGAKVQQVVLNLLQNAADALARHDGERRIRIATRPCPVHEGGALLVVEDTGPGIPPHVRERMYDPLFTTKRDGTGLGLSIVHRIMSEHGGIIECTPREGGGTVFTCHFPRTPLPQTTKREGKASALDATTAQPLRNAP